MSLSKGFAGVAFAVALACASGAAAAKPPTPDVNTPAMSFTLTTLDGRKVTLADVKGKVVVLNYWATWCAPCRGEMIVMDDYVRAHPKSDILIYAITTQSELPKKYMQRMADALSFGLGVKLRSNGYGMIHGALPTSYVIGRDGVVRYAKEGAFDKQSFAALLTPLLAEAAPVAGQP